MNYELNPGWAKCDCAHGFVPSIESITRQRAELSRWLSLWATSAQNVLITWLLHTSVWLLICLGKQTWNPIWRYTLRKVFYCAQHTGAMFELKRQFACDQHKCGSWLLIVQIFTRNSTFRRMLAEFLVSTHILSIEFAGAIVRNGQILILANSNEVLATNQMSLRVKYFKQLPASHVN